MHVQAELHAKQAPASVDAQIEQENALGDGRSLYERVVGRQHSLSPDGTPRDLPHHFLQLLLPGQPGCDVLYVREVALT